MTAAGTFDSPHVPQPTGLALQPFRATRYDLERAAAAAGDPSTDPRDALGALTSPPYDVIGEPERARLEQASACNVVRLILPRGDDAGRYAAARTLLDAWQAEGVLRTDHDPALYVYEERTAAGHVQRGLVGALELARPDAGIVLPHEDTMAGPVADRLALYSAVEGDLEPIFLVYDGGGATSRVVAGVDDAPPLLEARTDDGVEHRVWAVTDPGVCAEIAADLAPRRAVIADGHHRYATYLQRQTEAHAAGLGAGPWDLGLTLLVDATSFGPEVHPIHRVIPGLPLAEAVARAGQGMRAQLIDGGPVAALDGLAALAPEDRPGFVVSDGTEAWLLDHPDPDRLRAAVPGDRSTAWQQLDVTVAHRLLIADLWGLADTVETVGFEHDVPTALAAAAAAGGTALLLAATPVTAVSAVAAAGDRMPRKSTLFTPKPRSGLLLRRFASA